MSHLKRVVPTIVKVCLSLALITFAIALVRAQNSGPVAAFAFSEGSGTTTTDASGNGNTGALQSGPTWTTGGRFGSALTFDGSNDFVELTSGPALTLSDAFSLEAWVYPTASTWHGVIGHSTSHVYELGISSSGVITLTANINGGDRQAIAPTPIVLNTWTHLAATYDGSILKLYVNGALAATNSVTGSLPSASGPVWIGKTPGFGVFQGRIDEVRIYNRALSATEIAVDRATPVDDTTPFQVSLITPPPGALGVATTPIAATFSRAIDASTLSSSSFDLQDPNNTTVSASVAYDATLRRATLTPASALSPSTEYSARIVGGGSGVKDSSGVALTDDFTWVFTTASASSEPRAAYAFSEGTGTTVVDLTGNGNTSTLFNGPTWTSSGKYGSGIVFDGVNDDVEAVDSDTLTFTNAFTFEAWVYPTASTWHGVVGHSANYAYELGISGSGIPAITAYLNGTYRNAQAPSAIPLNAWTHLAATYDGSALKLYVNGTLVATTTTTGSLPAVTGPVLIGRTRGYGVFQGTLDEVRLYNRALSATQIGGDMSAPVDPITPFQITARGPSDGAVGVTSSAAVTAVFNRALDAATLTASTFNLTGPGNNSIAASLNYDAATLTATLTPNNPLDPLTTYTAHALSGPSGLKDSTGVALENDVTWTFTTAAAETAARAAYAFSEGSGTTTADASGNGNAGALQNGPTWTADGRFGSALTFDGGNDLVQVAGGSTLTLSDAFTLEAWVYPTGATYHGVIGHSTSHVYDLGISDRGVIAITANLTGVSRQAIAPTPIALNTWTHLAATYDGSALKLYVNGRLAATNSDSGVSGSLPSASGPVWIGRTEGGAFQGKLDEVRVYNRALSGTEIAMDRATPVDDTTPFQVSLTTPSPGALGIATTPVTATFSRPIDASTLTTATFELRDPNNTTVSASVAYDATLRRGTLTPASALAASTQYTARLVGGGTGVKDSNGVALTDDLTWVFTTASATSEPRAAFAFSEGTGTSVADVTGNGNIGTLFNGAAWTSSGKYGNGLVFDGVNDDVEAIDSDTLTFTNAFTFEAWVYPTAATWHGVVGHSANYAYELGISGSGIPAITAYLNGNYRNAQAPSAIPLNAWTHLAATYDGSALKLYVNGTLVATTTTTGSLPAVTGPVLIGRTRGYGVFQGTLDEVRLYNRALSAADVATDMSTSIEDSTPPAVTSTTPATGASNVVVNVNVTATFSEDLSGASVTSSTFELRDSDNDIVPASVSYSAASHLAILQSTAALTHGGPYTARVKGGPSGVTDVAGNPLAADYVWTFSTASDLRARAEFAFSEGDGTTTADASGNGNAGTLTDATMWTPYGRFGNAPYFDGVDDAIVVGDAASLNVTNAMTLEAWVMPTWADHGGRILDKGAYSLALGDDGSIQAAISTPDGGVHVARGTTLPLYQWTHVAATYDANQLRVYVNGFLDVSTPATGTIATDGSSLYIGSNAAGLAFTGELDEVRIYGRALSANEVAVDAATPIDDNTPFQVSRYTPTEWSGVLTTPVTATFSRAIDTATLTAETFKLVDPSGNVVESTVTYDPASRTATLTPAAALAPLAGYTAVVAGGSAGVTDTMGVPSDIDTTWWFQTATAPDVPAAAFAFAEGSGSLTFDQSGNFHVGELRSAVSWNSGVYDSAAFFDGMGAAIEVPDSDVLRLTDAFTISAWLYPTGNGGTVLNKGRGQYFLVEDENGQVRVGFVRQDGTSVDLSSAGTALSPNAWNHVAVTFDGTSVRWYLNGIATDTQSATGTLQGGRGPLSIGSNRGDTPFAGGVDELRLYRRALTAEEVVTDMTTPLVPPPPPPPAVSLVVTPQSLTIAPGTTARLFAMVTYGDGATKNVTATAEWSSSDPMTATVDAGTATGIQAGVVTLTASSDGLTASAELQVAAPPALPPNPSTVAQPLNSTVPTSLRDATAFLYSGSDPIQVGVAPDTIETRRAAALHGVVLTRDGQPLDGVTVSVKDHPEFGNTRSRADGGFDLAVNGGGTLAVQYEKAGFLPVTRDVAVAWEHVGNVPDAALIPLDPQATAIDLTASTSIQVARGSASTDSDGTRRATLLFPQGTSASLVMPDGTTQSLRSLTVRATEYTVGPNGLSAMPAPLPPTSAYTYAVELSADEAIATGARSVQFSAPIPVYVENFIGLPVGSQVPAGFYDSVREGWVASDNGRVIAVLGITGGMADVDVNGDGQPDVGAALTALQLTDNERGQLATLYQPGQSLWRVPVPHFSPWDFNLAVQAAGGGGGPSPQTTAANQETSKTCTTGGSIIECQNQTLGEEVPVTGTPFALTYRSNRAAGRVSRRSFAIQLTKDTVPDSLQWIEVIARFGSREVIQGFQPQANQQASLTWDGKDQYDRPVFGTTPVDIDVNYLYSSVYLLSDALKAFGSPGGTPSEIAARRPAVSTSKLHMDLAGTPPPATALGGWNLSVHHVYDRVGKVLYRGDGTQVNADAIGQISRQVASDRGATAVVGPDGSRYNMRIGIAPALVERVLPNDEVEVLGPAPFGVAARLAVDPKGRTYRLTARGGSFTTQLSLFRYLPGADEETLASSSVPNNVAGGIQLQVASDGTAYVAFGAAIYRVGVGSNDFVTIHTAMPATEGALSIMGMALRADGTLYWSETRPETDFLGGTRMRGRIYRMPPSGTPECVGGNGQAGSAPDGNLAVDSALGPMALTLDRDGSIVFLESTSEPFTPVQNRVRRISSDGVLSTVAGGEQPGFFDDLGDNGPALGARYRLSGASELSAGPDGNLYLTEGFDHEHLRSISPAASGVSTSTFRIPSEDGAELYEFSEDGRHLRTLHALTGAALYSFEYDEAGRLKSVTDGDGLVTTIERNEDDGAPTAIVGPFGQRTTLTLDDHGYLATITAPGGGATHLTTSEEGLLTEFRDANGHASVMEYDEEGRLLSDTDAAGGSKTLARTETDKGWTASVTTALGRAHTYDVTRGEPGDEATTITAPDGTKTVTTRKADGTSETVAADGTKTTTKLGPDPRFGMSVAVPKSVTVRTPSGLMLSKSTTRIADLADPSNPLTLLALTDTTVVNGRTYQAMFNALTRTSTTTSPAGRTSTSRIDAQGRVTRTQVGSLTPVDFAYDTHGRLTTITQGTRQSSIAYDQSGRPSLVTDALSRSVAFGYDAAGRVTTQTLPDTRAIGFAYDAKGNVSSLTPPGRPAHTFTHTAVDLTASYVPPEVADAGSTTYAFNIDRQPTAIHRPDAQTTAFGYDTGGRLSTVTFSRGNLGFTYDTAGRVSGVSDPGGVNLAFTYDGSLPLSEAWSGPFAGAVSRTFTNNFELESEKVNSAFAVNFGYDDDRLLTSAGQLSIARDVANGLVTGTTLGATTQAFEYNTFGEPTRQTAQVSGSTVFDDHITRDAGGRITQRVETIDGLTRVFDYVYDVPGRLSIVRRNGTLVVMYTYDENGNRIVAEGEAGLVEGTYDGQDRALTYGNESYTYTANGELATKTVAGQTTSYSYDTLGNLIEVTKPEGTVITYTVDGRGRRVEKAIGGFPVKRWIYADQLRPIAELDGNGTVVSRFVYGTRMNVPEYVIKNGVTYRIFSDHLGSPRIVMNAATGEVVQRMDFQAFGESIQDSNPGWQPFGFAGGLYDPDTGLVRFGARDYDPRVGNWTAKDPTLFEGRSLNLYGYAVSDPVNLLDSEGESWESAAWAAAEGAAVGATGALAVGGIAVGAATIGVPAAAITTGLAAVVVVGAAVTGYNIVEAVGRGDWDAVANDVGGVIGGMAAGAASGRWVAEGVNGVKSPPWGWRSDAAQMYDRNYPGGSPGKWWATGPNPGSAAGATGSGGAGVAALLRSLQCK